jgi:hypothetical protein
MKRGKRQRNKNSDSSIEVPDVSPKKRRSTHSTESVEGQGETTGSGKGQGETTGSGKGQGEASGSGKRKRKRRDSETEVSQRLEGESGETEDKSNCPRKGKKRKQKSMSDTSASESDVSRSGEFSGSETEKKRKISQEGVGEKRGGEGELGSEMEKKRKISQEGVGQKMGGSGESSAVTSKGSRERTSGGKGVQEERRRKLGGDTVLHRDVPEKLESGVLVSKVEDSAKGTPTTKKDKRKRKKKHREKSVPELRVIPK